MRYFIPILCVMLLCGSAIALEAQGDIEGLHYTLYGPDWCWQKRDINIMAIFDNQGMEPLEATLSITFPEGDPPPFTLEHPMEQTFTIEPGEEQRLAFTEISVSPEAPRDVYEMTLRIAQLGAEPVEVPYPVRTVRGAAVSPGAWALYLPVALATAWSIIIFLVLCRMSSPRAWLEIKQPSTGGDAT